MVKNDPTIAEARSVPLVQCIVDYFDVLRVRPTQCVEQCSVVRNKMLTNPIQSDSFDEIELHKVRCEVADALGKANGLAGEGCSGIMMYVHGVGCFCSPTSVVSFRNNVP